MAYDMQLEKLVRRSNLLLPASDAVALTDAWRHDADAVTIDLEGVPEARSAVRAAIGPAGRGGAEVFVKVNKASLQADLEASVFPGLAGIVLPQVESAEDVRNAVAIIEGLEGKRGLARESLQIIVVLESAKGVWNMRSILHASHRITQATLDEADLARQMSIHTDGQHDPFVYARGRLIIEAIAAKVQPIGMAWPLSLEPRLLPVAEVLTAANRARNYGMKGVICPFPEWVAPVNTAFTPSEELVTWNRRVREAFAAGVAAGTAAVPLDGRMIDVPVDEWAKKVLAMAENCAARDAAKRGARQRA